MREVAKRNLKEEEEDLAKTSSKCDYPSLMGRALRYDCAWPPSLVACHISEEFPRLSRGLHLHITAVIIIIINLSFIYKFSKFFLL